MGTKKLSDKEKVTRVKRMLLDALKRRKEHGPSGETLGFVVGAMCNAYALLDADKEDFQQVNFVGTQLWMEVTGIKMQDLLPSEAKQLQLGETVGVLDEQKSTNATKNPRK